MAAFEQAVRMGYRYLETDAHATSDGVLLAFHDPSLDRVTDSTGRIADLPWSVVRQARVGGLEPIPLLDDLLGAWPDVRVNIDAKSDAALGPLAETLRRAAAYERVCVGAFSGSRLRRFRRLTGGQVCTSSGPADVARLRLASLGLPAGPFAGACLQVPVSWSGLPVVDRRFLDAAHRRDLPVHVWTIDDRLEMERLLDLGVDGIMTDRPDVLKEVLADRGQWA